MKRIFFSKMTPILAALAAGIFWVGGQIIEKTFLPQSPELTSARFTQSPSPISAGHTGLPQDAMQSFRELADFEQEIRRAQSDIQTLPTSAFSSSIGNLELPPYQTRELSAPDPMSSEETVYDSTKPVTLSSLSSAAKSRSLQKRRESPLSGQALAMLEIGKIKRPDPRPSTSDSGAYASPEPTPVRGAYYAPEAEKIEYERIEKPVRVEQQSPTPDSNRYDGMILLGEIKLIDRDNDVVIINRGLNHGVQEGLILWVYRKGVPVGQIMVEFAEPHISSAYAVNAQITNFNVGDMIRSHPQQ